MIGALYYTFWEYWELRHKVTFDGLNKLILVNPGVTSLDFKQDVYSAWKQWVMLTSHLENASYPDAIRSIGGDAIDVEAGKFVGATFFLRNGWRMRTWEGNHRLTLDGNVYTEEGEAPFVPTPGFYSISIEYRTSNIIDTVSIEGTALSLTPEQIALAVRAELGVELARLDTTVSSRASAATTNAIESKIDALTSELDLVKTICSTLNVNVDYLVAASNNIDVNIVDMLALIEALSKFESNRTKIDPTLKTLTVFDNDGVTPWKVFSLLDRTGTPSVDEIAERVPQ